MCKIGLRAHKTIRYTDLDEAPERKTVVSRPVQHLVWGSLPRVERASDSSELLSSVVGHTSGVVGVEVPHPPLCAVYLHLHLQVSAVFDIHSSCTHRGPVRRQHGCCCCCC